MAKDKTKSGVRNRHLHARISYLQQAATYLTVQGGRAGEIKRPSPSDFKAVNVEQPVSPPGIPDPGLVHPIETSNESSLPASATATSNTAVRKSGLTMPPSGGLPQHLTTHLRQVARKSQIRLHTNIKHAICRTCNAVLLDGENSTRRMENLSRGGRKAHADVLVIECGVCGAGKRLPVGAKRQKGKGEREQVKQVDDRGMANGTDVDTASAKVMNDGIPLNEACSLESARSRHLARLRFRRRRQSPDESTISALHLDQTQAKFFATETTKQYQQRLRKAPA